MGMKINFRKSTISMQNLDEKDINILANRFPYEMKYVSWGMKYLGFYLKPNNYMNPDLRWLITKLEKRSSYWSFK